MENWPRSSIRSSLAITSSGPTGRTPSSNSTRSSPASSATSFVPITCATSGLKKGLDHLDAVQKRFQTITDRFAGFQAQCLNVHVDFPLLQRLALPITIGSGPYPRIKIHDPRLIRLMGQLPHGPNTPSGSPADDSHDTGRPHATLHA